MATLLVDRAHPVGRQLLAGNNMLRNMQVWGGPSEKMVMELFVIQSGTIKRFSLYTYSRGQGHRI